MVDWGSVAWLPIISSLPDRSGLWAHASLRCCHAALLSLVQCLLGPSAPAARDPGSGIASPVEVPSAWRHTQNSILFNHARNGTSTLYR